MTKKLTTLSILLVTLVLITGITAATHVLIPNKQTSESTFHSLNDIYNLIMSGTTKDVPNSPVFTTNTPTATTSHSIGEIYTILANIKVDKASSTTGSLIPTASASTDYTLEDIWNLINNGTYATKGAHLRATTSSPVPTMHTTSEIYDHLNTTFRNNLSLSKVRSGAYYFGNSNPGTFVMANLDEYCDANDECSTGWCGDDSWYGWQTGTTQCTTGEIGSVCNNVNQCSTGYCGYGRCTDGSIGSMCDSNSQCSTGFCDVNVTSTCTDGSIGSGCGSNADCATGLYCGDVYGNYGYPTCTDGSVGQYCGPDSCAPGNYCNYNDYTCAATDGNLGSSCGRQSDCDAGLYCSEVSYTCTDGSVGAACYQGNQCSSGYCNTDFSECTTGALGDACGANGDCISAYCGYDGVQSFCTDGSIGSDCNTNIACSSNLCSTVTGQCISGEVGSTCTVSQECTSTYCDTSIGECKLNGEDGTSCGGASECDSYLCSSNICTIYPLLDFLVAYYPLDEIYNTNKTRDLYESSLDGTLYGNTSVYSPGKVNGAFTFDGNGDYINVPGAQFNLDDQFTISLWYNSSKDTTAANTWTGIASKGGYSNSWRLLDLGKHFQLQLTFGTDTTPSRTINSPSWTIGTWHHLVVTYDRSNIYTYFDGALVGSPIAETRTLKTSVQSLQIGFAQFSNKGNIDEFAIWKRALTVNEVAQLYNNGNGMSIITP
ncbi:MAG: LamG domain-containing protein [Candidatus Paceibacterota bacterium]|jgi:hypothetical protein